MRYLFILFTALISLTALGQVRLVPGQRMDSTLEEVSRFPNSPYMKGRRAIIASFKHVHDSIIASNPYWKNNIKRWQDSIKYHLKKREDTLAWDTVKNRRKLNSSFRQWQLYHKKVEQFKDRMGAAWCPYAEKLKAYNRQWHVVGDMKAECAIKPEE
jgi:hypothetical protein